MLFIDLVLLTLTLFVVYLLHAIRRPKNFPPGPIGLPIIGNFLLIKKLAKAFGGQHLAFLKLSQEYNTDILGLKVGKDNVVVVSSFPLAKEILSKDELLGRPDNVFFRIRCMGKIRGISCSDGDLWNVQRNFIVKHLRNLGFGKVTMEKMIQDEIKTIFSVLKEEGSNIQMGKFLAPAVLNILCVLITGSRVSEKNSNLYKLLDLLHVRGKAFDMLGGTMSVLPVLRFIFPEKSGFNLVLRLNAELKGVFMDTIKLHHQSWQEGKDDDLIYAFISEMKKAQGQATTFTDEQLIMVCLDLFIAGSETTSNTLDFAFMMMILHPDVQYKIQAQMDQLFGQDVYLQYSDREMIPYVEAVLLEVERLQYVMPITGIRRATDHVRLGGYDIPKDTTVYINQYAINHDEKYWKDAEEFQPERFLDENGLLVHHEENFPFGMGKRRCIGEILAKKSIFLIFTSILKKYSVSILPGTDLPTGKGGKVGISMSAEQYRLRFIPRT